MFTIVAPKPDRVFPSFAGPGQVCVAVQKVIVDSCAWGNYTDVYLQDICDCLF